jgi:hypothetical protein
MSNADDEVKVFSVTGVTRTGTDKTTAEDYLQRKTPSELPGTGTY